MGGLIGRVGHKFVPGFLVGGYAVIDLKFVVQVTPRVRATFDRLLGFRILQHCNTRRVRSMGATSKHHGQDGHGDYHWSPLCVARSCILTGARAPPPGGYDPYAKLGVGMPQLDTTFNDMELLAGMPTPQAAAQVENVLLQLPQVDLNTTSLV